MSSAVFERYLVQDVLYLHSFAQVLNKAAGKAQQSEWARLLQRRANRALEYEQCIKDKLSGSHAPPQEPYSRAERSVACREYVSLLQSAATFRSFAETMAAILPCYWFYAELGKALLRTGSKRDAYQQWIDSFAAPTYSKTMWAMLSVTEEVAQTLPPVRREGLKRIFRRAAEMELLFWESAYIRSMSDISRNSQLRRPVTRGL